MVKYNPHVSKIGFGTWQTGGVSEIDGRPNGWVNVNDDESIASLRFAFEHGIRFIDTAAGYGWGHAEEIIQRALSPYYKDTFPPVICTKFGTVKSGNHHIQRFDEKNLRTSVEDSLKRIGREYLDIILMHNPPDDFDWSNYDTEPYQKLKREGKIASYGVSCRSIKGAGKLVESGWGEAIECIYNALDRRAEEYVFTSLNAAQYFFIGRVPLASGFLTQQRIASEDIFFSPDDVRSSLPVEASQWMHTSSKNLSFLNELEGGISVSALRFCITHEGTDVIIPGLYKRSYVTDALKAMWLGGLDKEEVKRIESAVPEVFEKWR